MKLASGRIAWARHRLTGRLSIAGRLGWLSTFLAMGVASLGRGPSIDALIGLFGLVTMGTLVASYIVGLTGAVSPGELEIAEGELRIKRSLGTARIPLERITSAWVVEKRMPGRTRAELHYAAIEIEIAGRDIVTAYARDPAEALAFVDALGFGPTGKRVHINLAKDTRRLLHPFLGFVSYIASMIVAIPITTRLGASAEAMTGMSYFIIGPLSLLLYAGLKRVLRVPHVTVGSDGVEVHRVRRRFIPRRDVVAVSQNVAALPLVLQLKNRSKVSVSAAGTDLERRVAAGRLIEQRLFGIAPSDKTFAFERGARSIEGWREELKQVMAGAGYRAIRTTPEDAEAVLQSPLATPEQRVGAALALRAAGDNERVRVAAHAAADPRVRVALEAVADDDDEAIERALKRSL